MLERVGDVRFQSSFRPPPTSSPTPMTVDALAVLVLELEGALQCLAAKDLLEVAERRHLVRHGPDVGVVEENLCEG